MDEGSGGCCGCLVFIFGVYFSVLVLKAIGLL